MHQLGHVYSGTDVNDIPARWLIGEHARSTAVLPYARMVSAGI